MDNIWKKALTILESKVNEQIFSAWFLPITEVSQEGSSITLGVPNKFYEDWLREKYISLISTALNQASKSTLSVKFEIVDSPTVEAPSDTNTNTSENTKEKITPSKEKDQGGGWLKNVFGGTTYIPKIVVHKLVLIQDILLMILL